MAMPAAASATFGLPTGASDWREGRSVDYARRMRTLLPCLLLLGCDTPGTFGSDLFGGDADARAAQADMIAQLEAEPETTAPPERVLAPVPALPASAWIQIFDRSARIAHQVHDDGRYTVQFGDGDAQTMPIISRLDPQASLLSPQARDRIVAAIDAVHFSEVAAQLPPVEMSPSEGVMVAKLTPLAITVRDPQTGGAHTVHTEADIRVAASFGPLQPLWRTLDDEVFGRWLQGAIAGSDAGTPR